MEIAGQESVVLIMESINVVGAIQDALDIFQAVAVDLHLRNYHHLILKI